MTLIGPTCLLDVDLPRLRSLSLRDDNAQNTILQASLYSFLVDTGREGERAVELSYRALANPVLRLGRLVLLGNLLLVGLLCDLVGLGRIILNGRLVTNLLLVRVLAVLDEALWALTFFADVLVATRDGQGVVVGPFNVDVLLLNTRELSVEFIALLCLLDVELGGEGPDALELAVEVTEGLAVVFVKQAEDGSKLLSESWEERHCCWCGCEVSSSCWFCDTVKLSGNA